MSSQGFVKVSTCPKCGAPIWNPTINQNTQLPPPTIFSCPCEQNSILTQAVKDLEKKVAELAKEVERLTVEDLASQTKKREILKD